MQIDQQIFLALAVGLAGLLPAEVAVRCSFNPGAVDQVVSESGKPKLSFVLQGPQAGKAVKPSMDELGVSALEVFSNAQGTRYGVVSGIEGLRAKEGWTIAFRLRPRSRMRWRPILGFRFGKHNYRLEQVAEPKSNNPITMALFRNAGQNLVQGMTRWHEKNKLELEQWYDIRLCYMDESFVLFVDGTEVERLKVPAEHGPDDRLTELVLGTGRDGDGAASGVKPGLYERLDEVCAWSGTSATPPAGKPVVKATVAEREAEPAKAKPSVELPVAAPDGSCVLAPKQGPLPEWQHTLKGGTLRIQPAQAGNPKPLTIEGHGRIEISCPFSDLTVTLNAQTFEGEVVVVDDATRQGAGKKLRSSGLLLGPEARLILSPGVQLYVVGQGAFDAPQIGVSGGGELNREGFGALRIESGATLESAIEMTGPTTLAATGTVAGRIWTQQEAPLLTLGRTADPTGQTKWVVPHLSGLKVDATLGSPNKPLDLLVNGGNVEMSGGSFSRNFTVQAPVRLTNGLHQAQELTIAPLQSLQIEGDAVLKAQTIRSTGNLIVAKGGTLAGGGKVTGSCIFLDGAQLEIAPGKVTSLSLLAMQHGSSLIITGNPTGMKGGKNPILTWQVCSDTLSDDDFLMGSDIPEGCELVLEGNTLSLNVPYAVAMGNLNIKLLNPDGSEATVKPSPEALSFVTAAALRGRSAAGDLRLTLEGSTSETPEMDAGQAVNVAYLLNLRPQASLIGGAISAQYLCNFGVAEVRRVGNNRIEATVMVEPFDGMGTLGAAPNGYIQILAKPDASAPQWAVLAEIPPGTPYRNGLITSAPFRNVHGGKTYKVFGVRLSPTSARK